MALTAQANFKDLGGIRLNDIPLHDAKINSKLEELHRLKELATKATSLVGCEVVSRTRNPDTMVDTIVKIVDMQNEVSSMIDLYIDAKYYYSRVIDSLDDPMQIKVLYDHYFSGKPLRQIAEETGYSHRNICYIKRKAMEAVEKIISEE